MWLAVVIGAGRSVLRAQDRPGSESGLFVLRSSGRRVGTERFLIRRGPAGVEAAGQLELEPPGGPRVSETSTLKLDAKLKPTSYERQQLAPKKGTLTVQFGAAETRLLSNVGPETQEQIFLLPDHDLVVLDTNFFHHYELLVRQYNVTRMGSQTFNVFVPQEATPAMIHLTFQGNENIQTADGALDLNHFQAATEDIKIEIWATPDGEIQRMEIPQANLEIVRQDSATR